MWALNPNQKRSHKSSSRKKKKKRAAAERDLICTKEKAKDCRGRDWSDVATCERVSASMGNSQIDCPLELLRKRSTAPADTLISAHFCQTPGSERINFCCFKQPKWW